MTNQVSLDSSPAARPNPRRMAVAIAAAIVLNLVVYGIGSAAGATWIANGQAVTWILVVIATLLAMLVGSVITWLLAKRWVKATAAMAWIGLVFAVVTAPSPLLASANIQTGWALATMHVITGIVWFIAIRPRRESVA